MEQRDISVDLRIDVSRLMLDTSRWVSVWNVFVLCDQVVAADARRLQVFSSDTYRHVRTLAPTLTKGQWGGVALQSTDGLLLASYTDPANRASRWGFLWNSFLADFVFLRTGGQPKRHVMATWVRLRSL